MTQAFNFAAGSKSRLLKLLSYYSGTPLDLIASETLRWKVQEPVLLLGKQRFQAVDIRIRAQGGGHVSQIYAIRQAIAKGLVAFYQKCTPSVMQMCILGTSSACAKAKACSVCGLGCKPNS